jgi:hypothetical protein
VENLVGFKEHLRHASSIGLRHTIEFLVCCEEMPVTGPTTQAMFLAPIEVPLTGLTAGLRSSTL